MSARISNVAAYAALLLSSTACNYVFSLDGYEGPKASGGASGDGGAAGAAGTDGGGFCPTDSIICDDFERDPSNIQGAWGSLSQTAGTLSIVEGTPTGRALDCQLAAGTTASTAYLAISAPSPITEQFSVRSLTRVAWSDPQKSVSVNALTFSGASAKTIVLPIVYAPGWLAIGEVRCATGNPCVYKQTAPASFSPNAWHDWSLVIDFSTVPARYTVEIDGAKALDAVPSPQGIEPGTVEIHGGAESGEAHGDFDVTVDDLVITGK
jgi:hypothetical protein